MKKLIYIYSAISSIVVPTTSFTEDFEVAAQNLCFDVTQ